jgi:hypothetical protein
MMCGDNYVSSYTEGAFLMMGIVTEFESPHDKEVFMNNTNGDFIMSRSMGDAAALINATVSAHNVKGNIYISALQKGGDKTALSDLMPGRGLCIDYYSLSCSFDNMTNCLNISSNLKDYAMQDF